MRSLPSFALAATAAFLLAGLSHGQALGAGLKGKPPLPRPKPAAIKRLAGSSKALNRKRPPLPRPRPVRNSRAAAVPAPPANTGGRPPPIQTSRGGKIELALPRLGRERNPDKAADLKATEKSSWSAAQVAEAKRRCQLILAATNVAGNIASPIGGSTGCGIAAPIKVSALGAVAIRPAATLNCTMAAALYKWVTKEVQPSAIKNFKQPVTQIRNISSYSCRSRRGVGGGRISEHSFGNALDIKSFTLASGVEVDLLKDWNQGIASFFGADPKGRFLSTVHEKACRYFSTALGPNYNKAHANHFHFDLGRAGRNKNCS